MLVTVLIVSLCVNLLIAGLIVGRVAGWFGEHDRKRRGPERAIERLVSTLPEEARPPVQARFVAREGEIRDRLAARHEARQRVASLLGQPNAPREELSDALAAVRLRSAAVQEVVHAALADAAAEMPPDVRSRWQPRWWEIR